MSGISLDKINHALKEDIPWKMISIFLFFSAVIILSGIYYYRYEKRRIFEEQEVSLSAIASLKVKQIELWYNEKLADAVVIKDNEPLIVRIKQYFNDDSKSGIKKEITVWLESLNKEYDYNSVTVLDTLLKVRLATSHSDSFADNSIRKELKEVIRDHEILMTDLHKTGKIPDIQMDLLVPLLDPENLEPKTIGLIILCIDPYKVLFPLVKSWPTPSKSSETLILRREGDSVLYLNELRHRKSTALNLKFSLSNVNLLATKAVNGFEGITEGIDYRKIPVIGALNKITGLPWYMVAKTDKEEILAPFKRYSIITVVVIILLIILIALASGYWIWAQRAKMYRRQLKDEMTLRESKEKLIASEERFRSLYENATIGIYRTTPDGKILLANPALVRMLGFSSFEDLAHRNLEEEGYKPDYPRAKFLEIIEKDGKIIGLESAWHRRNGEALIIRESANAVHDAKGRIIYYDGTVEDITDRKKTEEALHENEKRLREAQEMAHLGFWFWDIKTGDVEWSYEVFKIFCLDPATFKPQIDSILELSPWPEDNQRGKELINRAIESHEPGTYEQKFLRPDKSIGYYYSTFRGSYDDEGDLISIVGTILDITERKKAEEALRNLNDELEQRVTQRTEQLEDANKELEAFSYSVSHDLRAPLRSVHGFTKILLEDYESQLDEEGKRICGIISASATQMGELIDDLLSFSRIGRSRLNPSEIDMKKIAKIIFEGMTSPTERKRIKMKIGRLPEAFGDVTLFGQVWTNLISNAIKYTSKNDVSEINIGSKVDGKMITYFIKDNGVGFDMQYAHKLFGVFQRLHSEAEFEGNGVGLAIIQRIILKHGGKVQAKGEVGKGATFYFSLPVQDINKKTHDTRHTTHD